MIKDRAQKQKCLRYVLSEDWFPQLELEVATNISTGTTVFNITDIDVLASIPDHFSGYRTLVFDCKTGHKMSPINRALWQKGLMTRVKADRGICILGNLNIESDHRYTAAQLGINLLSEIEFDLFANSTSSRYNKKLGALADVDLWDKYFSIASTNKNLTSAITFSKSRYWMAENEADACRRTLVQLALLKPELNPEKKEHITIVADLTALFLHALAAVVNTIFSHYLQPKSRDELSNALLFILYGGHESYQQLNNIRKIIMSAKGVEKVEDRLALPEWDSFVQLVRQMLDAPLELNKTPLIVREIAWSFLAEKEDKDYARFLSSRYPQGARFAVIGVIYVCRAAGLPPEFEEILTKELMSIQVTK